MANVIAGRLTHPVLSGRLISGARDAAAPIDTIHPAKIGPNAILQLIEVLREEQHDLWLRDVFYRSGLSPMLVSPPASMVEACAVADLYHTLFERLPPAAARRIAGKAGTYTGHYILENRIPKLAQGVLNVLPAKYAASLLLRAIQRHAWTFAGSGVTTIVTRPWFALDIKANPIAMPGCVWHVAVFETLFRQLVSPDVCVTHAACCLDGASSCRFDIKLPSDLKR